MNFHVSYVLEHKSQIRSQNRENDHFDGVGNPIFFFREKKSYRGLLRCCNGSIIISIS